jgi:ribosome-binding protein aMBF1 (putative translation factor)
MITNYNKNRTIFELSNTTTQKSSMSENSLQINVGKRIQNIRESKGISQQELERKNRPHYIFLFRLRHKHQ